MQKNNSISHSLIPYFVLAYAFSWAIGVPLALKHLGLLSTNLPDWAHYFVSYGPLLSALVVTAWQEGKSGLKALFKSLFRWQVPLIWWGAALSPLLLGALTALIVTAISGQPISLASLGEVNFLPPLGLLALPLWLVTFGLGEETGWRGFALPRLQRKFNALTASLFLAVLWGLWHLPQFFYLFSPTIAVGWFLGLTCGSILFTWLFNNTRGSILITAVWHGCFNFITASNAGNGVLAAVVSTLVMVWAVVLIFLYPFGSNLSHSPRVTSLEGIDE